eukprot:jgi/Bigna1/70212/fgenesh1_pg.11_\
MVTHCFVEISRKLFSSEKSTRTGNREEGGGNAAMAELEVSSWNPSACVYVVEEGRRPRFDAPVVSVEDAKCFLWTEEGLYGTFVYPFADANTARSTCALTSNTNSEKILCNIPDGVAISIVVRVESGTSPLPHLIQISSTFVFSYSTRAFARTFTVCEWILLDGKNGDEPINRAMNFTAPWVRGLLHARARAFQRRRTELKRRQMNDSTTGEGVGYHPIEDHFEHIPRDFRPILVILVLNLFVYHLSLVAATLGTLYGFDNYRRSRESMISTIIGSLTAKAMKKVTKILRPPLLFVSISTAAFIPEILRSFFDALLKALGIQHVSTVLYIFSLILSFFCGFSLGAQFQEMISKVPKQDELDPRLNVYAVELWKCAMEALGIHRTNPMQRLGYLSIITLPALLALCHSMLQW